MAKVLAFLTAFSCLLLAACRGGNTGELTVAAAANTRFAMEALTRSFTRETGIACRTVFSSSGKLTAQIRGGAPFDILVSADMRYPRSLFSSGYTAAAPEIYAYGRLVLWSLDSGVIPSPDQLSSPRITHIALANPKTAPYGAAAVEVLKRHDLYEKVENKLVYGESISQTNQFTI
ncbi:MAG TPA: molybdate ABC transporter substrate-binding protein, partial [Anseongella sp.]|nr:molybdate ABC transporter substrate-binding protein [Anseongella sp.]